MFCLCKLYSCILNRRFKTYLECQNLLSDEQNGVRPNRSCEDHVFVANSIIRNRLSEKKDTFGTFIDLQKAFDFVNRDMLLYKMLSKNIDGKFYNSVKSLLTNTVSSVKLNGKLTDWFPVSSGVRQGHQNSPTCFAFFINDLIDGLKTLNKGVKFGDKEICCLFYADDILILSENEADMQNMLDYFQNWCRKQQYINT